jgi:signal transduction histidine kinase
MTPLSAIAAAAEVMKDQRFGPLGTARYVGYATDIHSSAQHALGVIERMLADAGGDLANAGGVLVSPTGTLNFAEIDAGAMLETSVSQVAPLAERAGVALTLELAPRLPRVVADATSLRQILFNLLTNALKFTERGGRVTVAARYNGDGPLRIAISDTGRGMSRREVEGLRGGQVPRRERRGGTRASAGGSAGVSAGLGLGLPLVRALAAANGAELVIESEPGRGTSACVVFGKDRVIPV